MPDFVLLWTDFLLFLLIAMVTVYIWYVRRKEHLIRPWKKVFRTKMGVIGGIVLSCYATIGVLDSIHYQPQLSEGQVEGVLSFFDYLVTPLRMQQEKTYSAPFATHSFSKENIEQADGTVKRDYPPLVWGGRSLDNIQEKPTDIAIRIFSGILLGIAVCFVFWFSYLYYRAKRSLQSISAQRQQFFKDKNYHYQRVAWWTWLVIIILICVTTLLAAEYHVFGTDKVGDDVLYQTLKSIRTGLLIGTLTTLIMLPAALILGIFAGFFRGWVDDVIQFTYTTLNSIPGVLLIAAAILMLQVYLTQNADQFSSLVERADLRLLFLCLILGITSWTGLCRLLRAESLKLRELDYVQAAQAFGVSPFVIIARHIAPNVMHIVLITIVLDFSGLVLAEAVLSYVNIGVDPTMNSWGNMINSARLEMAREPIVWWSLTASFIFMFVLVLAANLFADVVRDAFDPRLHHQH